MIHKNDYQIKKHVIRRSIREIKQQLKYNPNNAECLSELAKLYWYKTEMITAKDFALKAISLSPALPDPYWVLASVHMYHKEPTTLYFPIAEKGYQLSPDTFEALVVYANACLSINNNNEGLKLLDKAIHLRPSDPWPRINRYIYYKSKKDDEIAKNEIRQLIKIHKSCFTIFLYYTDLVSTKTGKMMFLFISILLTILILCAALFKTPLLMILPIIWYFQGFLEGYFQSKFDKKKGGIIIIRTVVSECFLIFIAWWINSLI